MRRRGSDGIRFGCGTGRMRARRRKAYQRGSLDDVEVMLDHHHGIALFHQRVEHLQQLADVFEVEAGGGFVQYVERVAGGAAARSEEHTSELQSLMRISYAVFCLKNKSECPDVITRYCSRTYGCTDR